MDFNIKVIRPYNVMKIQLQALKNLIRESLLLETDCPVCGSDGAYVGLNDVECSNPRCDHYDVKVADPSGLGNRSMFAKEFPDAYDEWWEFVARKPGEYSPGSSEDSSYYEFDDYYGEPIVYDKKTHKEFYWDEELGWIEGLLDSDNDSDYGDYDEDDPAADMLGFPRLPGDPGYSP